MTTLADRLALAFNPGLHKQADLARAAKVKPPSVAAWFSGDTVSLKAAPLVRAASYLGVNALWLATGEGPMRPCAPAPAATGAREPPAPWHDGAYHLGVFSPGNPVAAAPAWPFEEIDRALVAALSHNERLMLEGALLQAASQLGLHIRRPKQ